MSSISAADTTTTAPDGALAPIALGPGEGEHLWFFGGLTTIKADGAATGGRMLLTEQTAPRGSGSPLHVHHNEDEWFYVLEGELTIWVDGQTVVAPAGAFVFGPRDVPHTFIVSSDEARFLLVTQPAGFEGFVRDARDARSRRGDPARADRAAGHGARAPGRRRPRPRDPRPSRHPGLRS